MNLVVLVGRLTKEPDVRYTAGEKPMAVARYTLAVDRRVRKQEGQQSADFINCVAFGASAEFAKNYLHKGTKIAVNGRIQTGSYVNKDGNTVYTTDVIVENQEFVESKKTSDGSQPVNNTQNNNDFMKIPEGVEEELPFV